MDNEENKAESLEPGEEHKLVIPSELPLLPVRDMVVFPFMILPLFVGRASARGDADFGPGSRIGKRVPVARSDRTGPREGIWSVRAGVGRGGGGRARAPSQRPADRARRPINELCGPGCHGGGKECGRHTGKNLVPAFDHGDRFRRPA